MEWCERRLLARIHRYTIKTLRAEIEPVAATDFLRFLFAWHGITADPRPEGPQALAATVAQLEGFEAAAAAWEADILPARLHDYDPAWLDSLCLSGRALWARVTPPKSTPGRERAGAPVRATPIALLLRAHLPLWQTLRASDEALPLAPAAAKVAEFLRARGASFFDEIAQGAGLLRTQAEAALGELVAAGCVNADSFSGLRALLLPADRRRARGYRRRRTATFGLEDAGRWTLLAAPPPAAEPKPDDDAIEKIARVLLTRYGVVFRRLLERESAMLPPWYQLLRVYRRLEARGEIRGGRFVGGFAGEQYALPDAVGALRETRRRAPAGKLVSLNAADPLNLIGILTPGARVPALAGNRILYRDGEPVAVQVGGDTRFLLEMPAEQEWTARNALILRAQRAAAKHLRQ